MKALPSISSISYMVQIFGWFRAEAARASRRKRSSACGSLASSSGRNFWGYVATEFQIFRFVDDAHPTAANLAEYAVVGDGLADVLGWGGHRREC
jgi:hypothetical protein